jgi:hypothetical protein
MAWLREVVKLGGLALQAEDCPVRAAVHHRSEHGSLARMENERCHQFIVWRAILPVWHAVLERDGGPDLIVGCEDGDHFFEMKNWRGAGSDGQLREQHDIGRLQDRPNGYFLGTSINPPDRTNQNFDYLLERLTGLEAYPRQEYRFLTDGMKGNALEFWVAGWPSVPLKP